jgi:L-threonylcarbamoyladenylate synthase
MPRESGADWTLMTGEDAAAPVTDAAIARAVDVLRGGGLVAFPTETVYGLGADATNRDALQRLYAVKGRPADHPVIVHLATAADLAAWAAAVPPAAAALGEAFWPGPLTVVVPRSTRVPDEVTGGRNTVALRVPAQPVALRLLRAFGGGLAAPSANRFGRVSPTTAADVRADLGGEVDVVLDGGPCAVGVESTIVECTGPRVVVVRLGGVPREAIERVLGYAVEVVDSGAIAAPGTRAAHYAPRTRVELVDRAEVRARAHALLADARRVGVLAVDPPPGLPPDVVLLTSPRDDVEFARVLYARLREADALALADLLVVPPANEGIGAAVADRLRRAAAGHPERAA